MDQNYLFQPRNTAYRNVRLNHDDFATVILNEARSVSALIQWQGTCDQLELPRRISYRFYKLILVAYN